MLSGVQDAAVLAQVQTHPQMCSPCPATPRNGSLQEAEHRCLDRRTLLVPMRNVKVKISLLLLCAGRALLGCATREVVPHPYFECIVLDGLNDITEEDLGGESVAVINDGL